MSRIGPIRDSRQSYQIPSNKDNIITLPDKEFACSKRICNDAVMIDKLKESLYTNLNCYVVMSLTGVSDNVIDSIYLRNGIGNIEIVMHIRVVREMWL